MYNKYVTVIVGDYDVTEELQTYEVIRKLLTYNTANLKFDRSFKQDYTGLIKEFDNVEIYKGQTKIFKGYVSRIVFDQDNTSIEAISPQDLLSREATEVWIQGQGGFDGTFSWLLNDIITTYTTLTPNITSTTKTVSRFVANHDKVINVINTLCTTIDYCWYVDPSQNKITIEPFGNTKYSKAVQKTDQVAKLKYEDDSSKKVSKLTVIGGRQTFTKTETFTGDGTTKFFQTAYIPVGSVSVSVNGTEKSGGRVGFSSSYDYVYWDTKQKFGVEFSTAPALGDSITVQYDYSVPGVLQSGSNSGVVVEHTVVEQQLQDFESVESYFNSYLNTYIQSVKKASVTVSGLYIDLFPGNKIDVYDPLDGKVNTYIVNQIKLNYPNYTSDLVLGKTIPSTQRWAESVEERIQRMERQMATGQGDIIKLLLNYSIDLTTQIDKVEIYSRKPEAFILGHPTMGKLGSPYPLGSVFIWDHNDYVWWDDWMTEQDIPTGKKIGWWSVSEEDTTGLDTLEHTVIP